MAHACGMPVAGVAGCVLRHKKGGYYKDDGPEANPPANLDQVPDAVPRIEPLASGANKPYKVFGQSYTPDISGGPYKVQGRASWYGKNSMATPPRMESAMTCMP